MTLGEKKDESPNHMHSNNISPLSPGHYSQILIHSRSYAKSSESPFSVTEQSIFSAHQDKSSVWRGALFIDPGTVPLPRC